MVLILRSLHSSFNHVCYQILVVDQVPSMLRLVTRFLRVPNLLKMKIDMVFKGSI